MCSKEVSADAVGAWRRVNGQGCGGRRGKKAEARDTGTPELVLQDKMVISQKKKEGRVGQRAARRVKVGRGRAWGTGRLQQGVGETGSSCSALKGLFKQRCLMA